jgi:hypothetical protein
VSRTFHPGCQPTNIKHDSTTAISRLLTVPYIALVPLRLGSKLLLAYHSLHQCGPLWKVDLLDMYELKAYDITHINTTFTGHVLWVMAYVLHHALTR